MPPESENHPFLILDHSRVDPKVESMFSPANPSKTPAYEKPEITDYGDLTDLTAGFSSKGQSDALWPIPRRDWTFSTP